jgi:hypothetical protein
MKITRVILPGAASPPPTHPLPARATRKRARAARRRGGEAARGRGGEEGTLYLDQNLDRIAACEGAFARSADRRCEYTACNGKGLRARERDGGGGSERSRHLLALVCHRPRVIS